MVFLWFAAGKSSNSYELWGIHRWSRLSDGTLKFDVHFPDCPWSQVLASLMFCIELVVNWVAIPSYRCLRGIFRVQVVEHRSWLIIFHHVERS